MISIRGPLGEDSARQAARDYIRGLPEKDRLIIILIHYERMTLRETGLTLDLPEEEVRNRYDEIRETLRQRSLRS